MIKITPNNNKIEFQLDVRNLELNKTTSRVLLEIGGQTLNIPLSINEKGYCEGVLPIIKTFSNRKGKICIEVISENFYFKPYETEILFESTKPKPKRRLRR